MTDFNERQLLQPDELKEFLINRLGVSQDINYVDPKTLLTSTSSAYAERNHMIGFAATEFQVSERYHAIADQLPEHLKNTRAFLQRHKEIIGFDEDKIAANELVQTINKNRSKLSNEENRNFEHRLAEVASEVTDLNLRHNPQLANLLGNAVSIFVERDSYNNSYKLKSGDGIDEVLPRKHAGIMQCGSALQDVIARSKEVRSGMYENIALLQSTYFSEKFSRNLATQTFGISPKRVFTYGDSLVDGVEDLITQRERNKRLKQGFGAIILSNIEHLPIEETKRVIDYSPELLATRGLLVISARDNFQENGSVFDLTNRARGVFGHDPKSINLMTVEGLDSSGIYPMDGSGRQVIFVKS